METKKNTKVAYESPVIETVELVLEGAVLDNSPGGGVDADTENDTWG